MKNFPYWGRTNIRRHRTKFGSQVYLEPGICGPLVTKCIICFIIRTPKFYPHSVFMCSVLFFFNGSTAFWGPRPPRFVEASRLHTLDTPPSVGLLWTSDQPVAETSTWQHTKLTTDRHPCLRPDFFFVLIPGFSPLIHLYCWSPFCPACHSMFHAIVHTSNTKQTSMPPVGFEPTIPASERPQTHALDRTATGIDSVWLGLSIIIIIIFPLNTFNP
jgi:hypothetical protein